jgi:FKBP-type peptidyl-prolyl cis-trans isomerase FklB
MKKNVMVALALLVAGATFNSVSAQQQPVSRIDTLSYTVGMTQAQGLKEYLSSRLNINLDYMDDFIVGLQEAVDSSSIQRKAAYYAGLQIGQQVATQMIPGINKEVFGKDSTQTLSTELFMEGFISSVLDKPTLVSLEDAKSTSKRLHTELKEESLLKIYGDNKKAGEDFLAANAKLAKKKKSGITILPSGLQYKVLQQGDGPIATASDKVKVKYEGRLIDGIVFDSTEQHGGEPVSFSPSQVIKGWTEALLMMPVGSKWQLYIPQELAYGSREVNTIPPFSALIFDVEVVGIEEPKKAESKKK